MKRWSVMVETLPRARKPIVARGLVLPLAIIVLMPFLAACMGDEGADATPTTVAAAATQTPVEADDPTTTVTATTTQAPPSPTSTATTEPTATNPPPTASPTEAPQPTVPTEPIVAGDRPVDRQLNWLLLAMNGVPQTNAEIEDRLHPAFIEQVPIFEFAALLDQLIELGPWDFNGYLGEPLSLDGYALVDGPERDYQLIVGLEFEAPNRFMTLLIVPYTVSPIELGAFEDIDGILEGSAPQISFQVAEISDGTCTQIHGINPDQSLAIASAFKLWVLLELAERVADGELSWDDTLPVWPGLVSLPSGTFQAEMEGLRPDLRTYAAKMIALSDNTATDHLIDLLGRENVEARFGATGHSTPERNMPLLLTRELFYLKLAADADVLGEYIAADSAGRRAFLDEIVVDLDQVDLNRLAIPTAIDSVEWFGSAADLCRVMLALHQAGEIDPVARDILATSSGADLNPEVWPFVGYKGGNEAGVGSGVWLLERGDGRRFVISVVMNDPDAAVDAGRIPDLANAVANLLIGFE